MDGAARRSYPSSWGAAQNNSERSLSEVELAFEGVPSKKGRHGERLSPLPHSIETMKIQLTRLALMALILNQPEWVEEFRPVEKPAVLVLWANSISMDTRDVSLGANGGSTLMSRREAVAPLTEPSAWETLRERLNVVVQPFASPEGHFVKRRRRGRNVPLVRQIDEADCGAAALAMVCRHFGRAVSLARIRQLVHTSTDGTSLAAITRAGPMRYVRMSDGYRLATSALTTRCATPVAKRWSAAPLCGVPSLS